MLILIQKKEKTLFWNSFEKKFKLMINSVHGKTIENLRKRINVILVNNARDYKKYVSKPSFVSQKLFSKDLVVMHKIKPVWTLDKPIYVGFSVLDLSKIFIYDYHYNYSKRKFDAKLLFTDTDSLTYEIKTEDIYEDFYKDKDLFDFSNYPEGSKFYDPSNMNEIGKMKDESEGKINIEFVGLKSKMYSLIDIDGEEKKKEKGVNSVVFKNIKHKEYLDFLLNSKIMRHKMKRIQSRLHKIGTYDVCKTSLSCVDAKRYILDDGINTLAYFHKETF